MVNVPDAESVVFTVLVKVGSRHESSEVNGVAHFLEHIFFKGSQNNPESSKISNIIDAIGGEMNAATSKEFTEFYIKAEKHNFDLIFETLTDMILNPLFTEAEIEKEKGVIHEEINLYLDNPGAQVDSNLEQAMWPNSALGREILGTKEIINSLDKKKLFQFKQSFYKPGNIILGVSGSFDAKHVVKKVKEHWLKLSPAKVPVMEKAADRQKKPSLNIDSRKTKQAHIALGFKSFGHDDDKNMATLLLGAILGGNTSSRLWLSIREQKGLAYYIRASNAPYFDTGNFNVMAGVKVDSAVEVLREIFSELRRVKSDPVSEKELRMAKDYVKGRIALVLEESNERLSWVMERFAITGKIKLPKDFFDKIEKVSAEDIKAVANEIFTDSRMSLAIIGPYKAKTLEKELHIKSNF